MHFAQSSTTALAIEAGMLQCDCSGTEIITSIYHMRDCSIEVSNLLKRTNGTGS